MDFARLVACLMSWEAPVVMSSNYFVLLPRVRQGQPVMSCSILPFELNISSFPERHRIALPAPPVGIMETLYTGPTSGSTWKRIACPASWNAVIRFSLSDMILLFFSAPIPTFDEGSLNIFLLQVYPVFLSCQDCRLIRRFSRSAPVNPAVVCAICLRSISSLSGFPFA